MAIATMGPEIGKSALIIVDMQNDFVHPEGSFGRRAREMPEAGIDMRFLKGIIPQVKRLADAFRARVIDATNESFVFEITGASEKIESFVNLMLPLGLVEVSRTGVVAIGRGPEGM